MFGRSAHQGQVVEIDVRSQGQVKIIKLRGRLVLGEAVDRLRATLEDLLRNGDTRLVPRSLTRFARTPCLFNYPAATCDTSRDGDFAVFP